MDTLIFSSTSFLWTASTCFLGGMEMEIEMENGEMENP